MRLSVVKSMLLERSDLRLTLQFTGGIPQQVMQFDTEAELLGKYDELVEIEEAEKHVE